MTAREFVTQLIEQLAITGAFARQRPIQCAHAHLQARGDVRGAWLAVAKLGLECIPDAVWDTRRCRGVDANVLSGVAVEERGECRICGDAIYLTGLLLDARATTTPEVHALLALMCLHAARMPARVDDEGTLVPLDQQDRSRWDAALVGRGMQHLSASAEAAGA